MGKVAFFEDKTSSNTKKKKAEIEDEPVCHLAQVNSTLVHFSDTHVL